MTLKNFEEYIEGIILQRGYEYFINGYVSSLENNSGEWVAEVSGSELYIVSVTVSSTGKILETDCDCPYDWGPFCKHQAAVFYALRDMPTASAQSAKAAKQPKETLDMVLRRLDKEALVSFLVEYAAKDRQMEELLLLRFSKPKDTLKYAKSLIRSSIKAVTRKNFVEYDDAMDATQGAYEVLRIADDIEQDAITRVSLCILVLEEMMRLLEFCDDSGGDVGGAIHEAIDTFLAITKDIPQAHPDIEKLFSLIFDHARSKLYDGWSDWRMDMLSACVPLCGQPTLRGQLEGYLDSVQNESEDFSLQFIVREAQKITYGLIALFDGESAAKKYIEDNIDNSNFRKIAIEAAIAQNELDRALQLCLDGEEMDAGWRGLVSEWKHFRYTVYEKQNNMDGKRSLAEYFLLHGEFAFYAHLKKMYVPEEWPCALERILNAMERGAGLYSAYTKILIEENHQERLLRFCQEQPLALAELYPHLIPAYAKEIDPLFADHIRLEAKRASDRSHYQALCWLIRHYHKACGIAGARAIKEELILAYPRRRAMIEELNKWKA